MNQEMAELRRDLDVVLQYLEELRRPVVKMLQKGISADEFEATTAILPFALPFELRILYEWRNGISCAPGTPLDDIHFFPGFYFPSLDETVAHYRALEGAPAWDARWFPVFTNGGGDFYASVCSITGSGNTAPVAFYLLGEIDQEVRYDSMCDMIRTTRACFEKGAYYLTADGFLEVNYAQRAQIAAELNPSVNLWKRTGPGGYAGLGGIEEGRKRGGG